MSVACAPRARIEVNAACPGGVQEGDHAVFSFNVVCTNVLGNAARFARGNFR